MEMGMDELLNMLQGHWQLENDQQNFEITGTEITVFSSSAPVKTSIELIRNLQLKNWQIKAKMPLSWARTFVVQADPESFVLYDFEPTVSMALGARSKMLNPSRVFRYNKVL
jgi:hypothetical protein